MPSTEHPILARFTSLALALTCCCPLAAQERQTFSLQQAVAAPWSLFENLPERQWIPGTTAFSQFDPVRREKVLRYQGDHEKATELFNGRQLNAALQKAGALSSGLRGTKLTTFRWLDAGRIRVQLPDGVFHWQPGTEQATRILALPRGGKPLAVSADDSRVAYRKEQQLFVQVGNQRHQLSTDGSADLVYGGPAHRSEFGIHDGLWWSADGRFLAFFREDMRPVATYPYVDHTVMPPKPVRGRYPMAGRANSLVHVGVYDTLNSKLVYLEGGAETDVYWTNTTFSPDGTRLFVAIVNRGQDHMQLVEFDSRTGKRHRVLFEASDQQWIEPEHGPMFLDDDSGRFLWFSPRDGYRHLYLHNRHGKLLGQVTKGAFDIAGFLGFDPDGKHALVHASGADPRQMHLWRARLDGGGMEQLTKGRGWHDCKLREDRQAALDSYSNLELPGRSTVLNLATGTTTQVVEIGHKFPVIGKQELFTVKADDGTELHGGIILPPDLDPTKRYPALLYVYGGPHSQLVKDRWLGGSSVWLHYMATQGFVVCTLDNRGTDNRGIEFAQAVHRRLSLLETRDQLTAVRHLRSLPFVDARRIGVHGWSYGGYMTLNLMLRSPGTFACAAAGAPVTDWAQYETGYTERYMDTPTENPQGFRQASIIPLAGKLRGRLLVIHGTDDKTVMWSHSLKLVEQFIAKGRLIDYMPYPMQKHGIRGRHRQHLYKLLTRYFRDHLGGPQ